VFLSFLRVLAAGALAEDIILDAGLPIASGAEWQLILDDFHLQDLSGWTETTDIVSERSEIDVVPDRIGPVVPFLKILSEVIPIHLVSDASIVLTG
jgi:hypothetical protein